MLILVLLIILVARNDVTRGCLFTLMNEIAAQLLILLLLIILVARNDVTRVGFFTLIYPDE